MRVHLPGMTHERNELGVTSEAVEDNLRARARRPLEQLLSSDNEQIALRASATLFS